MPEKYDGEVKHASECPECGKDTYAYERYCHCCGADRWDQRDR